VAILSGGSRFKKAKPIERWGRKATGLSDSFYPLLLGFSGGSKVSIIEDSRTVECDILKVTACVMLLFFFRTIEMLNNEMIHFHGLKVHDRVTNA
jgi:hypothetical protein